MLNNRKAIIIIVILLILLATIFIGYHVLNKKSAPIKPNPIPTNITQPSPTQIVFTDSELPTPIPDDQIPTEPPTPIPQAGDIILDGIAVQDFKKSAIRTTKSGEVILDENNEYQIVFYESLQEFKLFIKGDDFEQSRTRAEQALLQNLDIDTQNVCRLFVDEFVPQSAKNKYAGQTFGLSYCEHE